MNKLILLLLLSIAFIGSANANSIQGAFGYKLGEVFDSPDTGIDYHDFIPKVPLPGLDRYTIFTTMTDKKIYQISGLTTDDNYPNNSSYGFNDYCTSLSSSPHHKILELLRVKYGQFKKVNDDYDKYTSPKFGEVEWIGLDYKFEDGDRFIYLECLAITGVGQYTLRLDYVDWTLHTQWNQELSEFLKNKLEDEASDYDI